MKTETSFVGPQRVARSSASSHPRATAGQRVAHAKARPRRPTAGDGEGPARVHGICYETYDTVSLVCSFTPAPSNFYVFTAAKSLAPRARIGATARALGDHAGLTRTSTVYLRGR